MDIQQILNLSLAQALGPTAVIYALAAIGLNVHFGYAGLLNFGQAGFMMVGGYAFVSVSVIWGGSLWLGIPIAFVLTIILALLLGIPTLRLRADYLAIVTIAPPRSSGRPSVPPASRTRSAGRTASPASSPPSATSTRSPAPSASPAWSPGKPTTSGS